MADNIVHANPNTTSNNLDAPKLPTIPLATPGDKSEPPSEWAASTISALDSSTASSDKPALKTEHSFLDSNTAVSTPGVQLPGAFPDARPGTYSQDAQYIKDAAVSVLEHAKGMVATAGDKVGEYLPESVAAYLPNYSNSQPHTSDVDPCLGDLPVSIHGETEAEQTTHTSSSSSFPPKSADNFFLKPANERETDANSPNASTRCLAGSRMVTPGASVAASDISENEPAAGPQDSQPGSLDNDSINTAPGLTPTSNLTPGESQRAPLSTASGFTVDKDSTDILAGKKSYANHSESQEGPFSTASGSVDEKDAKNILAGKHSHADDSEHTRTDALTSDPNPTSRTPDLITTANIASPANQNTDASSNPKDHVEKSPLTSSVVHGGLGSRDFDNPDAPAHGNDLTAYTTSPTSEDKAKDSDAGMGEKAAVAAVMAGGMAGASSGAKNSDMHSHPSPALAPGAGAAPGIGANNKSSTATDSSYVNSGTKTSGTPLKLSPSEPGSGANSTSASVPPVTSTSTSNPTTASSSNTQPPTLPPKDHAVVDSHSADTTDAHASDDTNTATKPKPAKGLSGFMDKLRGEMKVLSGKLEHKPEKVDEGLKMMGKPASGKN